MAWLSVQGTVTDRGKKPPFIIPLNVAVTIWREDTGFSHALEGDTISDTEGGFEYRVWVPPATEDEFTASGSAAQKTGAAGGLIAVEVTAYSPGSDTLRYQSPVAAFFGRGQTFIGVANDLVGDLKYDIDLSGLEQVTVRAILEADELTQDAFANVDGLLCELMHNAANPVQLPFVAQSIRLPCTVAFAAPALRDENKYTATMIVDPGEIASGEQYFRFRSDGPDFASKVVVRCPPLDDGWLGGPSTRYTLVSRVEESVGIGTISSGLSDRTFRFPFILKDPDILARFKQLSTEPVGSSPGEFAAFVRAELDKYARVIKAAGIKLE
jgi:hypothetical protein